MNRNLPSSNQPLDARTAAAATGKALRLMAGFVISFILVLALYYGQDIFIPLALSVLLAFLLQPLVSRLKKWGLPQLPSIAVVVLLSLSVLGGAATYFGMQLGQLSQELPKYQTTIQQKLSNLKQFTQGPSVWDGALTTLNTVEKTVKEVAPEQELQGVQKVQVVENQPEQSQAAQAWLGRVLSPLATAGIVFLFVVLILLNRKDLHDRLLKLLGGNLNVGTDALAEAAERIGTYLRMQLLVNVSYGIPMAIGLFVIGVPAAIMWGMVAILMRFVPYVGPMISAVFPITLAFAVDPSWDMVLWTVALILVLELISNNVIEPWLYGESTGLSTLAIIVAATFWTALWGPVGLILSTPLTACLLVLANYIPALSFVKILIGNEPVLSFAERFYQRLVADDVDEALAVAEQYIQDDLPKKPSSDVLARKINHFYDEVALPAIVLFSNSHNTAASAEHRLSLQQGLKLFNHEFQQRYLAAPSDLAASVLSIGARWEIDSLSAVMVAHGLNLRQISTICSTDALLQSHTTLHLEQYQDIKIVCISMFHQQPLAQIRLLNYHLRAVLPEAKLILALWGNDSDSLRDEVQQRFQPNAIVHGMNELMLSVDALLWEMGESPISKKLAENEPERLQALHELDLVNEDNLPIYQQYIEEACQAFDVKYAQISLVDETWVNTPASPLAGRDQQPLQRGLPRDDSICTHLVYQNSALVIEDIARDPRFQLNKELNKNNIRFYAGVPLTTKQGLVLGSFCILDQHSREMSEDDLTLLHDLSEELMRNLTHQKSKAQKLAEIAKLQQPDV